VLHPHCLLFACPQPEDRRAAKRRPAMASVLSSEETILGFVLVHRLTLKIHSQLIIATKNIK
jgi:hypothetical protein